MFFKHFASKNQLRGSSISGKLFENELILFTSLSIMRHDISKKKFSLFLKRIELSKRLSTIVAAKQLQTKAHPFTADNKWCTNTIKALAWHNSHSNLKMKFCLVYFYKMLCLKINWNQVRAPFMLHSNNLPQPPTFFLSFTMISCPYLRKNERNWLDMLIRNPIIIRFD